MTAELEPFELEAQSAAELAEAACRKPGSAHWPGVLRAMLDVTALSLRRAGIEAERAEELARLVMAAQAFYVGGRNIYLPAGDDLKRALEYDEIFHAARRGNIEVLAARYGVTPRRISQIVREQTLLRRAKMQPQLFPPD